MISLSRILVLATVFVAVIASSGDRSADFGKCLTRCTKDQCHPGYTQPLALRLTRWTCTDDCKYTCMHETTAHDIARGDRVQQYYGKWPFLRLAGLQEPASVVFSVLNLWSHVQGMQKLRKAIPDSHPMKSYYLLWSLASINAWTWSSVFHTRDLPATEKLDYFSAALAIMYALYFTVVRLFHLYSPLQRSRLTSSSTSPRNRVHKTWSLLCTVAYLAHVSYLTLMPRFDYTYNMAFNLVIGLTHNVLWLLYSLPASLSILRRFPSRPKSYRPSFTSKAALFVVLTTAATSLELFDFPPWMWAIDAHALWHLSTAPIASLWYNFLLEDALDDSWKDHRI